MSWVSKPLRGIGIPAPWWLYGEINAAESSYTETSPQAGGVGVPSSSTALGVVRAHGEQDEDLVLVATSAGLPRVRRGAEWRYRRSTTDATTASRGWLPPNVITGWRSAEYDASATAESSTPHGCYMPWNGKVCAVYQRDDRYKAAVWSPLTGFATAVEIDDDDDTIDGLIGVCAIPSQERLIAVLLDCATGPVVDRTTSYTSTDDGATWSRLADEPWTPTEQSPTTLYRMRVLRLADDSILLWWLFEETGTTTSETHLSTDLGCTFAQVDTDTHVGFPDVVALLSGGYGMVSINGSNRPQWARVGSGTGLMSAATQVEVDASQTVSEVTAWQDHDGTIYVTGRSSGSWYLWASFDDGVLWSKLDYGWHASGDSSTYARNLYPVAASGYTLMLHQWAANPGTQGASIAGIALGGWSSLQIGPVFGGRGADLLGRGGFGPPRSGGGSTQTWLPFDLPASCGWTATGAGTDALGANGNTVTTTANTRYYTDAGSGTTNASCLGTAEVRITSGAGSVTSTIVGVQIRSADGTNDVAAEINLSTTQIRVIDTNAGTTKATVSFASSTAVQLAWELYRSTTSGNRGVSVYARRLGDGTWTQVFCGTLTNNTATPAATGYCYIGNVASGTATSVWSHMQVHWRSDLTSASQRRLRNLGSSFAPSSGVWGGTTVLGRSLTPRPYPAGDIATAGPTLLSMVDGPAAAAETHTIGVVHDYGIDRVFAEVSPSPAEHWRSTDDGTEVIVAVEPAAGGSASLGPIAYLYIGDTNIHTAKLEGYNGVTWVEIDEWDAEVLDDPTGTCEIIGDEIYPAALLTTSQGRYYRRNELAGGTALIDGTYFRIVSNTEGVWERSATTTTKRMRIRVNLNDGALTPGTVQVWAPKGVLIVHDLAATGYELYRVRIPAPAGTPATPQSYWYAGVVSLGAVQPFGKQHSRGFSIDAEPRVTETESASGTVRVSERGPMRRRVTLAWPDGVRLADLRGGVDLDWLAATSGDAPATVRNDVPWLLEGIYRDLESGSRPCLWLPAIPVTDGMITDPTLFLWGILRGSVSQEHVSGDEGDAEYVRVAALTVTELV